MDPITVRKVRELSLLLMSEIELNIHKLEDREISPMVFVYNMNSGVQYWASLIKSLVKVQP